jgi:hypothetical protein
VHAHTWCKVRAKLSLSLINKAQRPKDDEPVLFSRYGDGIRAERTGFDSQQGQFFTASRQALGSTQSLLQWVPEALSPAVKRPGREADHSPPSSVEVYNAGAMSPLSYTSSWRDA